MGSICCSCYEEPSWVDKRVLKTLGLTLVHVLNAGGTCRVISVRNKENEMLAMKLIQIEDENKINRQTFHNELGLLQLIQTCGIYNDSVQELISSFMSEHECIILTKLYDGGDLYDIIISRHMKFTETEAVKLAKQMLTSILYIHTLNIVHRDIKPENFVLSTAENRLRLIDFGEALHIDDDVMATDHVGSILYVAPEVTYEKKMNGLGWKQADMWSFGVIVYLLLNGKTPFKGNCDLETVAHIREGKLSFEKKTHISSNAVDFVISLLRQEPHMRMTAEQAMQHPWITQMNSNTHADPQKLHSDIQALEYLRKDRDMKRSSSRKQFLEEKANTRKPSANKHFVLTNSPDLRPKSGRQRPLERSFNLTGPALPYTSFQTDEENNAHTPLLPN